MSFGGITPPPTFLSTPGKPNVPWTQWRQLFCNFLGASGAEEFTSKRKKQILLHYILTVVSQPDQKDVTVHSSELTEGSETEDDEYEKEHEGHHSKSHVHRTLNPEERLFLGAESSLRELLSQCPCGSSDAETDITTRGTWLRAATACSCGKLRTWSSRPWVEDRPLGNILLCSAILFSGVNITKAFRMFAMMEVPTLTLSQYFRTQKQHLFPVVNDVFLSRQAELLDRLRPVPLTLAGDSRCDSPGHTALYGTYTLLETVANRIIHFELSTEVSSSNAMEVHGLQNCLAYLEAHDMVVDTIVTDRHTAIKSVLRELCPHIKHRFDVWHVAKGIKKKLVSLSHSTKHHVVKFWIESLIRHIYWCPKYSGESGDLCLAKWVSAVNHIVDVHEHHNPLYPVCYHGPVSEPPEWLKEDYASTLIAEVLTRIQEHHTQSAAAETRPARSATYGENPTLRQAVNNTKHGSRRESRPCPQRLRTTDSWPSCHMTSQTALFRAIQCFTQRQALLHMGSSEKTAAWNLLKL
ncbi:uncharacterized protein LOC135395819 [Ornithodoros turicata]|uniref:uncharacterized protein LOC135395819 n=1 Tax=Ornithodoros turicata TaxID=34597 RepID=UPI00313A2B2F